MPGAGEAIEVWILGSSTYGAQLAAALGLPYAFASHFAPEQMHDALAIYRERFRPSERLAAPHVMLGVNVFVADTDAEAARLFTLPSARIGVLIHPQSVIHSLVAYVDGSVLAQLGSPDMRSRASMDSTAATGIWSLRVMRS